jgi:iron complex outermembrane receptor protein
MTNPSHLSSQKLTTYKITTLALAISSAFYVSPVVLAQENAGELEEISVTGTRIRVTDGMAEPTPVTSLTPMELTSFEPGGTVSEQLDALPQFFSTGTAQRGAPALFGDGGGSYLDMRGLGRARTLVLLDGSRIVPADKLGFVNVDNIPTALVRSIDVITGGASAAYGADALGGVTNFVIDRQFEGFKLNVGTGMNEMNHDGRNYNLSVAGGKAFGDRWNVIGSLEMRHIDEIYRKGSDLDPDWFQRWGHMTNPNAGPGQPARITMPWVTATTVSPSGVIRAPGSRLNGLQFTDDGKALAPFILGDVTAAGLTSGGPEPRRMDRATATPINGNGVENRSGFVGVQFQASDRLRLHAQGLVGRVESSSIGEHATMIQSSPWSMQIFRGNPYLPAEVNAALVAENRTSFLMDKAGSYLGDFEAGAGEYTRTTFTTESYATGFTFDLPNEWVLSGNYQAGESRKKGGEYPSLRIDREALARDAVIHPVTGAIVCNVQVVNPTEAQLAAAPEIRGYIDERHGTPLTSPIGLDNSIRDCVPYNALGAGNMTKAAWDYMHTPKTADSWVKQNFAELLLQGEAHEGWGAGPISFATGLTWREQSFHDEAAQEFVDSFGPPINVPSLGIRGISTSYTNGTPHLHNLSTISFLNGEYDVWEAFGELQVPIWESASSAQRLGGNLAFRRSDYSSSGAQDSWKVGFEFQVFEDLRLRATKSRDVREGTFSERFNTETGGANVNDPFSRTPTTPVNISYQRIGDPNIRPEKANTNVVGFVYEPSFLEGFQVSTDWYEVDIHDSIESISEQNIVDQCFQVQRFCDNLIRNSEGVLALVRSEQKNLSLTRVEGVDMEVSYRMEPDFFGNESESLTVRFLAGHLMERIDYPFLGAPIDRVGGSTRPDYKGNLSLSYSAGPWSGTWQQRYISDTLLNTTWVEGVDVDNNTVPTYSFTNLNFAYSGTNSTFGGDWRVSLAVNNAFDKDPPIFPSAGARFGSQIGAGTGFDEFGRRYQLTLNMNF